MKSKIIVMKTVDKMQEFCQHASHVDGDVNVKSGQYFVNGKSLFGVLSLATHLGVTVEYPNDATAFEKYLDEVF